MAADTQEEQKRREVARGGAAHPGRIWQALKIPEWQKAYSNAKSMLPGKAKALWIHLKSYLPRYFSRAKISTLF